jgi:hypothetical protein
MQEWILTGLVGALVALAAVLMVALRRARAQARAVLASSHQEAESLEARLEGIERRLVTRPVADQPEFVITDLGDPAPAPVPARIEGRLFVDLVLRDSVVKAAALAHGLRRALSPEGRHRVRYEFSLGVKLARRERRAELRRARRHLRDTRRGDGKGTRSEDAA